MNTIKVAFAQMNENISIANLSKFPVLDSFEKYWDGDSQSFSDFLNENGCDLSKVEQIRNIKDVIEFSNGAFDFFKKQNAKNNIGKLDFKLASILKARFLTDFKMEDFQTIALDISSFENEDAKKAIKEAFESVQTNAFIDFKEIVDDTLYYTYNRKGLLFDGDRFSIATARERISLAENYKSAKDNNFISAKLILELSKIIAERGLSEASFSTTIITPNGSYENTYSVKEIIKESLMTQEDREQAKEAEQIKKAAIQEIKDEKNLTRVSLKPESNIEQIDKASPEIRINNSYAVKVNYEDENFLQSVFDKYEEIQLEAIKQKLKNARENGHKAYATLKANINNGLPIYEAMNVVKQEFRDDEVVRFASFLLTKDLLDLSKVEDEATSLKVELAEINAQNDNLSLQIAKKETTIKEFQATVAKKNNEMNILKEEYSSEMQRLQSDVESKIQSIRAGFEDKISEANKIIDEQEKIISKLQGYEENYKASKEQISKLEAKNETLNTEKTNLQNKFYNLERDFSNLERDLVSKNRVLAAENSNLKKDLQKLEKQFEGFESLKDENKELALKEKILNKRVVELNRSISQKDKLITQLASANSRVEEEDNDELKREYKGQKKQRVADILGKSSVIKKQ